MSYNDMIRAEYLQAYTLLLWWLMFVCYLGALAGLSRPLQTRGTFLFFLCGGVVSVLLYARYF